MKKRIIFLLAAIGVAVLTFLFVAYRLGFFYKASDQQIRFMTEINNADAFVFYYGNLDPDKEITLNYKKFEHASDIIGEKSNHKYNFIVIFDFDGSLNLSDDEFLVMKKLCEEQYYDIMYYGDAHLDDFIRNGFFSGLMEDALCFTYNGSFWINRTEKDHYFEPYLLEGIWDRRDDSRYNHNDRHVMWKCTIDYMTTIIDESRK